MALSAREFTDKELDKIQRRLVTIYRDAQQDISGELQAFAEIIKKRADKLLKAIKEAKTEEERKTARSAYNRFYLIEVKRDKRFRDMTGQVAQRLSEANKEAAAYINTKTAEVYARNYNEVGKEIAKATEYTLKPVSVEDAGKYGEITKQKVNAQKDEAWNKRNIVSGVVGGILLLNGAEKVFSRAAKAVIERNLETAHRYASDTLTDAESKGRLDSMHRAFDEGFEVQKQWICVYDNRTRDSHIGYNDIGPVPLDYQYTRGLQRPRDPNCFLPEETCNCRCAITVVPGKKKGTRSARKGTVTGSYKEQRSFAGTESVNISDMTYAEWMAWRS